MVQNKNELGRSATLPKCDGKNAVRFHRHELNAIPTPSLIGWDAVATSESSKTFAGSTFKVKLVRPAGRSVMRGLLLKVNGGALSGTATGLNAFWHCVKELRIKNVCRTKFQNGSSIPESFTLLGHVMHQLAYLKPSYAEWNTQKYLGGWGSETVANYPTDWTDVDYNASYNYYIDLQFLLFGSKPIYIFDDVMSDTTLFEFELEIRPYTSIDADSADTASKIIAATVVDLVSYWSDFADDDNCTKNALEKLGQTTYNINLPKTLEHIETFSSTTSIDLDELIPELPNKKIASCSALSVDCYLSTHVQGLTDATSSYTNGTNSISFYQPINLSSLYLRSPGSIDMLGMKNSFFDQVGPTDFIASGLSYLSTIAPSKHVNFLHNSRNGTIANLYWLPVGVNTKLTASQLVVDPNSTGDGASRTIYITAHMNCILVSQPEGIVIQYEGPHDHE